MDAAAVQQWFEAHVALDGKPYTLDLDQAAAVADDHQNCLVVARAGSGKTRVIVAKVAFLVAYHHIPLSEIAIFMFNRTAAAEVNQRLATIQVDGKSLPQPPRPAASTFHKFAYDLVQYTDGRRPNLISEADQTALVGHCLQTALNDACSNFNNTQLKLNAKQSIPGTGLLQLDAAARAELTQIVTSFIARAGQKYPGVDNFDRLESAVKTTTPSAPKSAIPNSSTPTTSKNPHLKLNPIQLSLAAYRNYLQNLPPRTDFNLLLHRAAGLLKSYVNNGNRTNSNNKPAWLNYRYLLIDEYQDFSDLFFNLTVALRQCCPHARLFAVGDDWQAINRFAGSDVDYFVNFDQFFPDDYTKIPLATNYRSDRRVVERANRFMLTNYDQHALPARAFSRQAGKIKILHPNKIRFDASDLAEDARLDGQFLRALGEASQLPPQTFLPAAGQLLKAALKILARHPYDSIMFLHRHNFTTLPNLDLPTFAAALRLVASERGIMTAEDFDRQVRVMTIHKSKGLEADVVGLLELNRELVWGEHPHNSLFPFFGDSRATERADQARLLYVALTRARHRLYILTADRKSPV